MRRFLVIVTALAALASGPTARADFFDTSMGVLVGGSMNLGTLGDKFQLTSWPPMVGMEANIRHSWLGLLWSFQVSDYNEGGKDLADNVNTTLDMWEMDFGLRAHVHPIPDVPIGLFGQATMNIERYSIPVDDAGDRNFIGPSLGGGIELGLHGFSLGIGSTYGLLWGGPTGVKLYLFVDLSGQ